MHGMAAVLMALLVSPLPSPSPPAPPPPTNAKLAVGIIHAPPFTIRGQDGAWTGISIDLWRGIAQDLSLDYELHERDLPGLLSGLQDGSLDVAVAALTITGERERVIDFTHPFYTSGLGVATLPGSHAWRVLANRVFSRAFAQTFFGLALLIFVVGAVVWLGERKANPEEFPPDPKRGLGAAFWWSAGTVTSVGYGDLAPRSLFGRVVAAIWMLVGLVLVSIFTATASSILTAERLESRVESVDDLRRLRVATVAASSGEEFLRAERVRFATSPRSLPALQALQAGKVEAVVADVPIMRYLAANELSGEVEVGRTIFRAESYGLGLRQGSTLREAINQRLLQRVGAPAWRDTLYRYMGADF